MSEYQHKDSVKKVIGDAEGVIGFLTEAVRKKPFSLILLDELEKADPNILNLFLQVMDDGRLTDGSGRTIDFTNTIIIATSNVGAIYIQDEIKKNSELGDIKKVLLNEYLNKVIRPELINRFNGIIVFKPLNEQNIIDITKLMLNKTKLMLENKNMNLEYSNEGVIKLAREGYDPQYGARPLRRLIQEKIENNIANELLANNLNIRDTVFINNEAKIEIIKAKKS
jgi:ATP-dependent Clp protease ATP-binding subunit ClpB